MGHKMLRLAQGVRFSLRLEIIKSSYHQLVVEGELASSVNVLLKRVEVRYSPQRHPTSLEKKLQKDGAWAAK